MPLYLGEEIVSPILVRTEECSREHVLEVEQLPTENVDDKAVYRLVRKKLLDILLYESGDGITYASAEGYIVGDCKEVPARSPNENEPNAIYAETENMIFTFDKSDMDWKKSETDELPFRGVIYDIKDITGQGFYALFSIKEEYYRYVENEFVRCKKPNILPITIDRNGTYDTKDLQDLEADGFGPVTVALPVSDEELVLTPSSGDETYEYDTYHNRVKVKAVPTRSLTITPGAQKQEFTYDLDENMEPCEKWFDRVTVEGLDIYSPTEKATAEVRVHLKPRIEKPTEEQISYFSYGRVADYPSMSQERFVNGVPVVEALWYLPSYDFSADAYADELPGSYYSLKALYFRTGNPFNERLFYVWADGVERLKSWAVTNGYDVSSVTGEGWQRVAEDKSVKTLTEEDLRTKDYMCVYSLLIPYGDYLESMFEIVDQSGQSVDVVGSVPGEQFCLLTQDKLCENSIWVKNKGWRECLRGNPDGLPLTGDIEYDDFCYLTVTARTFGTSTLTFDIIAYIREEEGKVKKIYSDSQAIPRVNGYMWKSVASRASLLGIEVKCESPLRFKFVATNAEKMSYSGSEESYVSAFISNIRHDTNISVVLEDTSA